MDVAASEHFFIMVGRILDDARLGRLSVRLELADGRTIEGVPDDWASGGSQELDDTGYDRRVAVAGAQLDLESVRQASIIHP